MCACSGHPRGEPALVVEYLTKRFGDRTACEDVSFEVGYGEVFGFLGPNGAGKTTTVRTLGTLIAPTSGSAVVAGIPLSGKNGPAIRSRIAMMPESPGLYLRLSVLASVPPLAIVALMSLDVIAVSTALALGLAAALLAIDLLAWRLVAAMFDRERLVTSRHA